MGVLAIEVDGLSKAYRIGQFNTGALTHDIKRWWALSRGLEDPYLKVGEANDRTLKGQSNIVWSLKDIDFQIEQGDAIGVIGRNGAGKSTLLKLLSRITSPTSGQIKIKGRIASLLEVGTGFHPELTGRENIYLNGAILGMRKAEIKRKFDEIVDFSGVERYIDTPVKRYSSGMYIRLAFAVAAHLDSEILIVDEVLAVGDAEFQKRCLGKMNSVSQGEGKTVLFVSHNLDSISTLCRKVLYLKNGQKSFIGDTREGLQLYTSSGAEGLTAQTDLDLSTSKRFGNGRVRFKSLSIRSDSTNVSFYTGDNISLDVELDAFDTIRDFTITVVIYSQAGLKILEMNNRIKNIEVNAIEGEVLKVRYMISELLLPAGEYLLGLWAGIPNEDMDGIEYATKLEIVKNNALINPNYSFQGFYQVKFNFNKI